MSSEDGTAASVAGLSAAIEEDGLYDGTSADVDDSGAVSQTPTPTDSSRRSSQLSLAVSEGDIVPPSAEASTVPKPPRLRSPGPSAGAPNGARQLVEKRRKAPPAGAETAARRPPTTGSDGSGDKRSIFTLDHVKKMFGPRPGPEPAQQQSRRPSRAGDDIELHQRLSRLSVDALPAVFLAKCLGEAPAAGLFGVDCVRKPVEALVRAAGKRKAKTGRPLPIAQLTVLAQGISMRPHPQSEGGQVAKEFHALDSVSYAVVDPGVERIFCLVTVAGAKPVCRAFLCNSADTAHRLVLAVAFAFESATTSGPSGGGGGSQGEVAHA